VISAHPDQHLSVPWVRMLNLRERPAFLVTTIQINLHGDCLFTFDWLLAKVLRHGALSELVQLLLDVQRLLIIVLTSVFLVVEEDLVFDLLHDALDSSLDILHSQPDPLSPLRGTLFQVLHKLLRQLGKDIVLVDLVGNYLAYRNDAEIEAFARPKDDAVFPYPLASSFHS